MVSTKVRLLKDTPMFSTVRFMLCGMATELQFTNSFLTPKKLGERWGLATQTIYNRVAVGAAMPPSIRFPSGARRWRLEDVVSWENAHTEDTQVAA